MTNESLRQRGPGMANGGVPPVCDCYAKSLALSATDLHTGLEIRQAQETGRAIMVWWPLNPSR